MPPAIDWDVYFLPAVRALLNGTVAPEPISNPPWVLAPLIPFAVLPYEVGRVLLFIAALVAFLLVARRFGAGRVGMLALLLSPFVLNSIAWGNVEWLAILGLVMPPPIGLLFLALKPQLTFVLMAYVVYATWRLGRVRSVVLLLLPLVLLTVVSTVLSGDWVTNLVGYSSRTVASNTSMFPIGVPFGLVLAYQAFRSNDLRSALLATVFLVPTTLSQTAWAVVPLAICASTGLSATATVATWASLWVNRTLWFF